MLRSGTEVTSAPAEPNVRPDRGIVSISKKEKTRILMLAVVVVMAVLTTGLSEVHFVHGANRLPKPFRSKLTGRLNLLIEYGWTGQYALQFDLIEKEVIEFHGWTRDEYARLEKGKEEKYGRMQSFDVGQANTKVGENQIGISGTATLLYERRRSLQPIIIVATLRDGQWYFAIVWAAV